MFVYQDGIETRAVRVGRHEYAFALRPQYTILLPFRTEVPYFIHVIDSREEGRNSYSPSGTWFDSR